MNQQSEIDLSKTINAIKNNKKSIFYATFLAFVLSIIYTFLATPYYKSYISINPMGDSSNLTSGGGLQSIISDFGINAGDFLSERPSFHIPDIVNSRVLKKAVINNNWKTSKGDPINLINYWEINDTTKFSVRKIIGQLISKNTNKNLESKYMESAIIKLNDQIIVNQEDSGLIIISVLMEESQLAADIANYIATYIKTYISDVTIAHSSKHREFIEERVKYAKQDLAESEEELKEFSEKNPFAVDTPELQLQRGRLMRNMEVNQQVYITLRQQYEMARINELKEIPVINILDHGEASTDKEKPKTLLVILFTLLISLFLSCSFFIVKDELRIID